MKKSLIFISILILISFTGLNAFSAECFNGNINLLLGSKIMDGDWDPADEQLSFGLMLDLSGKNWPVHLVADILAATKDARGIYKKYSNDLMKMDVNTEELHLGFRKYIKINETLSPYIGLGFAVIHANMSLDGDTESFSDDDTAYGWWGGAGIRFKATEELGLGFDLRYSQAETKLAGIDMEVGGFRAGIFIGINW